MKSTRTEDFQVKKKKIGCFFKFFILLRIPGCSSCCLQFSRAARTLTSSVDKGQDLLSEVDCWISQWFTIVPIVIAL